MVIHFNVKMEDVSNKIIYVTVMWTVMTGVTKTPRCAVGVQLICIWKLTLLFNFPSFGLLSKITLSLLLWYKFHRIFYLGTLLSHSLTRCYLIVLQVVILKQTLVICRVFVNNIIYKNIFSFKGLVGIVLKRCLNYICIHISHRHWKWFFSYFFMVSLKDVLYFRKKIGRFWYFF